MKAPTDILQISTEVLTTRIGLGGMLQYNAHEEALKNRISNSSDFLVTFKPTQHVRKRVMA